MAIRLNRAGRLVLAGLLILPVAAEAQPTPLYEAAQRQAALETLRPAAVQPRPVPPTCRRGRRALIGALIGVGASIPLAVVAHTRFENEAASGAGAAATTLALGAAAGAFIGLSTCR
jgi:hypothetical protein